MRFLRLAAGLLISGAALYIAFAGVDWFAVRDALGEANYWLLLAAVPVLLVFITMRAQRWRLLFRPDKHVGLLPAFGALNIGYMASNLFPFQLGDLVRVYVLGETERISKARVLSTVAVERVVDVLVLLAILAALIPFIDLPGAAVTTASAILGMSLALLAVIVFAVRDRGRAERWLRLVLRPVPARFRPAGEGVVESLLDGLSALRHLTILLQVLFWTLVSWLTSSLALLLVLKAFSLDVPISAAPFLLVATTFGFFVPASPGGVGVYHAISVHSLTTVFAVAHEPASSYALVAHALYLVPPIILGAGFLWSRQISLPTLRLRSAAPATATRGAQPAQLRPQPFPDPGRSLERRPLRIFTALTYYTPHISGLTVYARRVVRRLAGRGHAVTVLTSHFNRDLPTSESMDGAKIIRSPVLMPVNKGALMPLFLWQAARQMIRHDVVYLHLPQFESGVLALMAKLMRKPVIVSYQCDIILPSRLLRWLFAGVIALSHHVACALANRIVTTSDDFAEHSPLLRSFSNKVVSVTPPIELERTGEDGASFRGRHGLGHGPLIGFVGRFSEEKGIDYLVEAVPAVLQAFPNARFVLAGPTDTVPGERVHERLRPQIKALGASWVHVGRLTDAELSGFYQAMDAVVLPSTNSTESYGMTQAEAMLAGTPAVTTDLPGVREAVHATRMGAVVPPRDGPALSRAIVSILREPESYRCPATEVRRRFDPENTVQFYEDLFLALTGSGRAAHAHLPAAEPLPAERGAGPEGDDGYRGERTATR